jgi:hypothetical protein
MREIAIIVVVALLGIMATELVARVLLSPV